MNRNDFMRLKGRAIVIAIVATLMMACTRALLAAPTITNLGVLSSDPFAGSGASGVSGDGSVVVGSSTFTSVSAHAFRWTSATGMQDLGTLPDGDFSEAYDVSSDGSVIVGYSRVPSDTFGSVSRAFRWTSTEGMQELDALPNCVGSHPYGVSTDGAVIVGESTEEGGLPHAFRWTASEGIQYLGTLPGGAWAVANGVSGDGAVIVGNALNVAAGGGVENLRAFRWTAAGGMHDLGTLLGGLFSQSSGVSADGSVVIGSANPAGLGSFAYHAFRWTNAGGMLDLGALPGGTYSTAYAANGNGSVVVGGSNTSNSNHAFLWTSSLGMVDLNTYLPSLGLDLSGWEFIDATAISPDGSAIAGNGYFHGDSRAWLVTGLLPVPEPGCIVLVGFSLAVIAMRHRRRGAFLLAVTTVLSLAVCCDHANAAQSMFMGLGDLPGGAFYSSATGVSADGAVVVGTSDTASGFEAFRWTLGTAMVGLGAPSTASDVSADGSVVVGRWGSQASRWTQNTGYVGLGDFPGGLFQSSASAVSGDGSVVVGRGTRRACNFMGGCHDVFPAFRWTQSSGMVQVSIGTATDISADGSVIVGGASLAARWTEAGGGESIGDLPGGSLSSFAWGVSDDGSVIVGQGHSDAGPEAFRWTQESGMVGLGILPGFYSSQALDVSADGSVVVGMVGTDTNASVGAFIWDEINQMRGLRDALINEYGLGASLAGWTLISANAISADGQFIVGIGTNPIGDTEAWLARLEPVTALPGDYNNDGHVGAADYTVWRDGLGSTYTMADYDVWKAHFGQSLGSGANGFAGAPAVPETASFTLAAGGLLGLSAFARRRQPR